MIYCARSGGLGLARLGLFEDIGSDAVRNPGRRRLDGVPRQMRIARGGVDYRTNPTLRVKRLRFFTVFTRLVGNGL